MPYCQIIISLMIVLCLGLGFVYLRAAVPMIRRYKQIKRVLDQEVDLLETLKAGQWDDCSELDRLSALLNAKPDISALKQAEYLALQNQINPHFLYNTLEAIRSDAICEGAQGIADTVKALASFFRYTISDVEYKVLLEDEIHHAENYFAIQKYRFDQLNMEVDLPTELFQIEIPKLILQPVVENAITHGLENKVGLGTVKIHADSTKESLWITVKDDGVGIEEDALMRLNERLNGRIPCPSTQQGGIALMNVNSRIRLIYGEEYGIQIYSIMGLGTTVKIHLPLIEMKK